MCLHFSSAPEGEASLNWEQNKKLVWKALPSKTWEVSKQVRYSLRVVQACMAFLCQLSHSFGNHYTSVKGTHTKEPWSPARLHMLSAAPEAALILCTETTARMGPQYARIQRTGNPRAATLSSQQIKHCTETQITIAKICMEAHSHTSLGAFPSCNSIVKVERGLFFSCFHYIHLVPISCYVLMISRAGAH